MIRRWQRHQTASAHMIAVRRSGGDELEFLEAALELGRQRIIGVIVEALVLPEGR